MKEGVQDGGKGIVCITKQGVFQRVLTRREAAFNRRTPTTGGERTVLGANAEQVDDVLVFVHHLHQLHL